MGQIRGGLQAYPESFLIEVTTQSDEPPRGYFKDALLRAREIRDGKRRDNMLALLYEFPQAVMLDEPKTPGWAHPAVWPRVTPSLGKPVQLDRLVEEFEKAKGVGEHEVRRWASQHLNIEVGLALMGTSWAGARHWPVGFDEVVTFDWMLAHCEVIVVGG